MTCRPYSTSKVKDVGDHLRVCGEPFRPGPLGGHERAELLGSAGQPWRPGVARSQSLKGRYLLGAVLPGQGVDPAEGFGEGGPDVALVVAATAKSCARSLGGGELVATSSECGPEHVSGARREEPPVAIVCGLARHAGQVVLTSSGEADVEVLSGSCAVHHQHGLVVTVQ